MSDSLRLIEDYLPIEAISAEASREKSVRKGHISTLHLWWARRPLVACRAAVYGALVPADRWVKQVKLKNPPDDPDKAERVRNGKKLGLNRKAAAEFVTRLCKYPGEPRVIAEAQKHILEAHAERLTQELAEALKTGNVPGWVDEFRWPFSFSPQPTATASGDSPPAPDALPAGSRLNEGSKAVVAYEDITAGRAPRPRVLDMFAGGGAIPLEALRLGCEAYALDLNPVAHIIELCTLVYPQKYGKPDPTVPGMTGPPLECGDSSPLSAETESLSHESKESGSAATQSGDKSPHSKKSWGGLAAEVRYWGQWVLEKVKAEIGDLYPPIPDPEAPAGRERMRERQTEFATEGFEQRGQMEFAKDLPGGYLTPVAYLWTRTVTCKNPSCRAIVPLLKQTWLCKKKDRYVALKIVAPRKEKRVRFEVVEAATEEDLGFDADAGSRGGNATCPFCGTVSDSDYVKVEGCAGRLGQQMMAVVCASAGHRGAVYFSADDMSNCAISAETIGARTAEICARAGLTVPGEAIEARMTGGICLPYGLTDFGKLFSPRQMLCLVALVAALRDAESAMRASDVPQAQLTALASYLSVAIDRVANYCTTLCVWRTTRTCVLPTFSRQALQMVWDFGEMNPFAGSAGDWSESVAHVAAVIDACAVPDRAAIVTRGSATNHEFADNSLDAVITDPPYYDNVDYAKLSDFFYVWLKRSIGGLYPEHFAASGTPKKSEAVADPVRHGGSKAKARTAYEGMMSDAFRNAARALKPDGALVVVYAHKTTLGWATLVDALRCTGFQVSEAWPIDTEMTGGMRAETASLSSSIFLVARKRTAENDGSYEDSVRPDLERIVRERVATLWDLGISGADLVIACVGSGLQAFTRFARVEYANGEEVPAEGFLSEVETVVLETILARLSKEVGGNGGKYSLAALDAASRFYVLWRYTYKAAELDAGEAIVFANGTHVELDGPEGLNAGSRAILQKKKGKYRLRDFSERGDDKDLGMPAADGQPAPIVDALHRTLWLMENRPAELPRFLREAQPNREQMRLVAQALAGPALKGGELADVSPSAEQAALGKLTANWRSVIEDAVTTATEREAKRTGQKTFDM